VVRTGDVVGALSSERLRGAGVLADDAVVIAGGHDHPIGGWSVDLIHHGAILDSMGTAEVVVAQSSGPRPVQRGEVDTAPGILSDGFTLLRVEELARNVDWASQDPAVARALRAIMRGDTSPDGYLHSDVFVAGTQGGGRPEYGAEAPRSAHSRASAVVGSLARLGTVAIGAVADQMPAASRVYAAGGWARSVGWMDVKRTFTGRDIAIVAEPEVTAVGAALLAATALGWPVSADVALAAEIGPS
jgi:xylulokinase